MEQRSFTLSDFDFDLPEHLLARYPAEHRDGSKLMVVRKSVESIDHVLFSDLPRYLNPGDLMVRNNSRVIPARMKARKEHQLKGALIDVLLVSEYPGAKLGWIMMLDPVKKLRPGQKLLFGESLTGIYAERLGERECLVTFPEVTDPGYLRERLFALGELPLPPYIKRPSTPHDAVRYQTVYASVSGALAAPTAGLHFTHALMHTLWQKGVCSAELTLHVGTGTFNSIYTEDLSAIKLHEEWYHIPAETAQKVNDLDKSRNKLLSIGTTSLRTLEAATGGDGLLKGGSGITDIFIKPPHTFRSANALLTNFHTPCSSLLMLVAAYLGYEKMRHCYAEAIREQYRFYSYGDAMLILE